MAAPLYDFGHTQEDDRTEAAALHLPGGRVLSITSAGEMALCLLARGAGEVVAVDISPNQNHLARLKLASALALDREDALRFLGYLPAAAAARRAWLLELMPSLPPPTRAFWDAHPDVAARGAIWGGRFERFLRVFLWLARPLLEPRFEVLFGCTTLDAQREVFARSFDIPAVHRLFRLAFNPRLYGGRGVDKRSVQHHDPGASLGEQFFARFRAACLQGPARDNLFLQLFTLGRVLDAGTAPSYLTPEGVAVVRAHADAIRFEDAEIVAYLQRRPLGTFDRFHLSNTPDWMTPEAFEALLGTVAERAARPAWLVWRYLHVDRQVPAALAGLIHVDRSWGADLEARDRFPIYGVVPARIGAEIAP